MIVLYLIGYILAAVGCAAGLMLFSAAACEAFDALTGREQSTFPYEKIDQIGKKYIDDVLWADEEDTPR